MQVKIEKLDHFGRGITYVNQKICFVAKALPNEIVKIKVTKETKKYIEAEIEEWVTTSSYRIPEVCPYAKICGGCDLEHLEYKKENEWKREKVKELLAKFSQIEKVEVKEIKYLSPYHYRNKVTLHGAKNRVGYYQLKSKNLVPIDTCLLLNQKINELLPKMKRLARENKVQEIVIRTSNDEKESLIKISGEKPKSLIDMKDITGIFFQEEQLQGKEEIISTIGKYQYYLSIESFFQVNQELTEMLYEEVLNEVKKVKPKKVLDLYCGTGTIGIYISSEAEEVIGIDSCSSSIKNANHNKKLNQVKNIQFINNKVENVIDQFQQDTDLIIVDPPRKGLDKKTLRHIIRIAPKYLIYISCDPVTLARDLKELKETYQTKIVTPFNMFPRTYHVECVSVLVHN